MTSNAFPKTLRIVKGKDFTLVLRRGGCAADGCLVVFAFPRQTSEGEENPATRLGVTIPKKTGNAVIRNRWKRWIREAFRTQQSAFPVGHDIVVRPKKGAVGSASQIRRGLPRLANKAVLRNRSTKSG